MDKYDYRDTFKGKPGIAVVGKDGKYGYINRQGVEITPLKYDSAGQFNGTFGWVQLDGKSGAVNRQGEEVIPLVYDEIFDPICIAPRIVRIGDKYGFVGYKTGKPITPVKYDNVTDWLLLYKMSETQEYEFLAKVKIDEKWGCINAHGEEILPVVYDEILVKDFQPLCIKVKLDGKWGCFSLNGKELLPPQYDDIIYNKPFIAAQLGGKWGFFDDNGKKITDFKYDEFEKYKFVYDFLEASQESSGILIVGKDGKFGYINERGVEITPLKYDRIKQFEETVGWVLLDGKWGAVNRRGEEITPPVYDEIEKAFCSHLCIVRIGDKYGYVDIYTGKLITAVKYDHAREWTQLSREGDLAAVQMDGKWGCINTRGKETVPVEYEEICICQFPPHIKAKLDGKWGYFNVRGKEIIPPIYEEMSVNKNHIAAKFDGKWGFLDRKGGKITDFEYDDVDDFRYGRARIKKDGKYGFINEKLAVAIPPVYDDCEMYFWEDSNPKKRMLPLWVKRDGKYGFIDISGNLKIEPKYEFAKSFMAAGNKKYLAAAVKNGAAGFIDRTGKTVIPFMYEPDIDNQHNYSFSYDGFANVRHGGKWGVIDAQNQVVLPFLYDEFLDDIRDGGFRCAMRGGAKVTVDAKGNEYDFAKNPAARTFKDYIHAVEWVDVVKSAVSLLCHESWDMNIFEKNFNNFHSKRHKPSNNIIRLYANVNKPDWDKMLIAVSMFSVEDKCSYVFFDWDEILDMEVRIEDNLMLTDADVVVLCIHEACDRVPGTEDDIKKYLKKLGERYEW